MALGPLYIHEKGIGNWKGKGGGVAIPLCGNHFKDFSYIQANLEALYRIELSVKSPESVRQGCWRLI